jgi:hypothetical protein
MKKKKTTSKGRPQVVHAYQSNPYAMQRRNAAPAAPQELVPIVVSPAPRRRRTTRVVQQAKQRLGDNQFLAETGLAAAGAVVSALATGWAAGKGWNPLAVGAATMVVGGVGALALPGAWRGAGIGMAGWGAGQVASSFVQDHAMTELERKAKADAEKKAIEQARADQQRALDQAAAQRALPPAKPSNAYMPPISDAYANARTYGHYGRADDEERMTDLDLVLG